VAWFPNIIAEPSAAREGWSSAGDTAWACLAHADEILVTAPGAFIASRDDQGIGAFLSRRG
jgi:hypothetical protein